MASDPLINDQAGLFDAGQVQALSELAQSQAAQATTLIDLVIVTTNDAEGKSSMAYADDYYDYHDYLPDGILLLIDLDNRELWISTSGTAIEAVSDQEIEAVLDVITPYAADGDFYNCAASFLTAALDCYANGQTRSNQPAGNIAVDVGGAVTSSATQAWPLSSLSIAAAVAGLLVALLLVFILYRRHTRTDRMVTTARSYLAANSFKLVAEQDTYTHTTRVQTKIKQDNDSSTGGGVHVGSSGTSHGGGGRGF